MRVHELELRRCRLPLRDTLATSRGPGHDRRDVLLVHARTSAGPGWGECGAPRAPTYTDEWVDGAHLAVRDLLGPRVLAAPLAMGELDGVLASVRGHPMAKAALELALLDAHLRAERRSLASWLGATRDRVPAGIAIGIGASVDATVAAVADAVDRGYRRVKLKIAPGADVGPLRAVRSAFPDLALQADANGAYELDDAEHLAALDGVGLQCLEQPLAADDLLGHAELAGRLATPICLDETITSVRLAEQAIALGACAVVNVKAARVGGLRAARAVHDVCREHGVPVWCGGMLDTGIARAADVALAALPGFTMTGDLSASDRWFARDLIAEPFVLDSDGCLAVPAAPGLGVDVDPEALEACTTSVEVLRAR